MGFIRAGIGAISGTLADEWKEYIYCDALDIDTLVKKGQQRQNRRSSNKKRDENIISDGSRVAVNEGQVMLVVENGKVVDAVTEAGAYIYDTGTEPCIFNKGFAGIKDTFKKIGRRFEYGGQPENDQRVYFVNAKEIMNNKVGIGNVPFRDGEFGFTIQLKGYGTYSYRIADPILFYTNICANVEDVFMKSEIDEQLKSEVQQCLHPALGRLSEKNIAYDKIPIYVNDIADYLNEELSKSWGEIRGLKIVSVAMASLRPDEESAKKIAQFQESRVYTNASMLGARIGGAQATAMENAASNEGGSMMGFMGMGFAQQAGGANASELMKMGQAGAGMTAAAEEEGWTCACGAKGNKGKFCSECGAKKPEEGWTCACGAKGNKGKFCSECGAKRPESAPVYKCDKCGWVPEDPSHPPKFCPECGDPFDDNDKK